MNFEDRFLASGAEHLARGLVFEGDRKAAAGALGALFVTPAAKTLTPALNFFRATNERDGEALFVFLARRKLLTVGEEAWPSLPEVAQAYFDTIARVMFGLVCERPPRPRVDTLVVQPKPRKIEDTIFEKGGSIGEKIGRGALAAGQPVSTEGVTITAPDVGASADAFAAFGGKNPGQWTEEEKLAFASKLGMPAASVKTDTLTSVAPAAAGPLRPREVSAFLDGEQIAGRVFVQNPFEDGEDE